MGVDRLKEGAIFIYSTREISSTAKVRFHYLLKGRDNTPGILEKVDGKHIGGAVLFIPKEYEIYVEQFMNDWNVKFEKISIILKDEEEKKE